VDAFTVCFAMGGELAEQLARPNHACLSCSRRLPVFAVHPFVCRRPDVPEQRQPDRAGARRERRTQLLAALILLTGCSFLELHRLSALLRAVDVALDLTSVLSFFFSSLFSKVG
jgi:hypothetical protein